MFSSLTGHSINKTIKHKNINKKQKQKLNSLSKIGP